MEREPFLPPVELEVNRSIIQALAVAVAKKRMTQELADECLEAYQSNYQANGMIPRQLKEGN